MLKVKDFLKDTTIHQSEDRPKDPQISVIMPIYCHNGELLERAIKSVLDQTFIDFEFIIVDDGSRDGSLETALNYMKNDKRIVVIEHKYNSGLPAIRVNEGIMESRGKYIAYQFDDDEYLPHCLQTLYDEMKKHNMPCAVYGDCLLNIYDDEKSNERVIGGNFNYGLLTGQNQIANNTVLHDKCIFDVIGLYDPNVILRRYCDYDLWLRMGKKFGFYNIGKVITKVYALQKGSLGKNIKIFNFGMIRRFIEIDRTNMLLPNKILDLEVDNLRIYGNNFSQSEIDFIYRREILPFINKNTYYLNEEQKYVYTISRSRQKNMLVTKGDYSTSVDVTIKNFLVRMRNMPYTYTFIPERELSLIEKENIDIISFYRSISDFSCKYMDMCKKNNIPSVYFMDDNMFKFYETGTAEYLAPGTRQSKNLEKMVGNSDCVISYNSIITDDCKKYNENVFELRTNISSKYLRKYDKKSFISDKIKFAVFSGEVRKNVFAKLWKAMKKIGEEYKNEISISFFGINPKEFGELSCETNYKEFTHSYDKYIEELRGNVFHYQICPLEGIIDAEKSKSPIKYLEGTLSGAVGIFSKCIPYKLLRDDCCFKVENNTVEEWYNVLKYAITLSQEERYKIYENAFNDIQTSWTSESQAIEFLTALESATLINNLKGRNIAYFMHESFLGGATLHLLRHALLMKSLGIGVVLCLPENQKGIDEFPNYIKKYGMEVNYLPCRRSVSPINRVDKDFLDAKVIKKWALENNIGMFHATLIFPALGIVAENLAIPNVATLHQYYENKNQPIRSEDCNIQIIHSSSNRYANEWQRVLKVPAYRIVCPVDQLFFDMYAENFKFNTNSIIDRKHINIIVSGTVQERKNQLGAINAIKILRDKGFPANLYIVGYDNLLPDYVQICKDRIDELNISEYIFFKGFINNPETYYDKNCSILLCSASNESMPQTILQAMAAGLFVVSTDCGGVTEIIKNNYNGIIIDGIEDEKIADGIERLLLLNEDELQFILSNARDTISAIADKKFVRSELLNIYNMAFDSVKTNVICGKTKLVNENMLVNKQEYENEVIKREEFYIPLSNKKGYSEVMGGRNLSNKKRKFTIIMYTGELIGLKFLVATNGGKYNGKLNVQIYCKKKLIKEKIFKVKEYGEIQWDFTPIRCSSGEKLELVFKYIPVEPTEWVCVYEKRKPLNLKNRVLYKLNLKNSYEIDGVGIFR